GRCPGNSVPQWCSGTSSTSTSTAWPLRCNADQPPPASTSTGPVRRSAISWEYVTMTSLEDQLHELFSSARTPVDGATGDIDRVRSEVRRRQLRRRTAGVIMTAAVIVLAAGVILASARDGNAVRTGPVTGPTTPTTDSPRSTTSGPAPPP